jgi:hypothetical protein
MGGAMIDEQIVCLFCERPVRLDSDSGLWVDPLATGDDSIWRETCEANTGSFMAEHSAVSIPVLTNLHLDPVWYGNVSDYANLIRDRGMVICDEQIGSFGVISDEWFEYLFPDGSRADVELWVWDDGKVRLTVYRQYDDADGFGATDYECYVPLGVLRDHDGRVVIG